MAKEEKGKEKKAESPRKVFLAAAASSASLTSAHIPSSKDQAFTKVLLLHSDYMCWTFLWFGIPPHLDSAFLSHNFLISVKILKVLALKNKPENMSSEEIQVTECKWWGGQGEISKKQTKAKKKPKKKKNLPKQNPDQKQTRKQGKRGFLFWKTGRNKKSGLLMSSSRTPTGVLPVGAPCTAPSRAPGQRGRFFCWAAERERAPSPCGRDLSPCSRPHPNGTADTWTS